MTRNTDAKSCYCFTCEQHFHHLGIMRHRAMHRDRGEFCEIEYGDGTVGRHAYNIKPRKVSADDSVQT